MAIITFLKKRDRAKDRSFIFSSTLKIDGGMDMSINPKKIVNEFNKDRQLWILTTIMMIWVAIFAYYPMYGLIIAFKEYVPGQPFSQGAWVGLKYYKDFFSSPEFGMIMRNTLAISGLNILIGFPAPIVLAVLLNEVKNNRFKKTIQTVSYIPHFISWVVVSSMLFSMLGNEGMLNTILINLGVINDPINYLAEGKYFWWILVGANLWKGIGWSSIIYLSAMAGIDEELYQAGAVDGLSRFGMIKYITIPCIAPTIILLFILGIGSILNAGFEQQLLLGTDQTRQYYEVIDTYVYKYGIQQGRYAYGTAVGLLKGIISVTLVFGVNRLAKKKLDLSVM